MRPIQFSADTVVALLRKQTVASLTDVMAAFGPRVSRRTAFRKLKDLHARTSYSHRGGYYTLDELADFDEHGLWTFAGVRFSRAGTLVATAEAFVNHAEAGSRLRPSHPPRRATRPMASPSRVGGGSGRRWRARATSTARRASAVGRTRCEPRSRWAF